MKYDPEQLQKDLKLIVAVFGERKQIGFYTYGLFESGSLKIEDTYIEPPRIILKAKNIPPEFLKIQTELAEKIMKLALKAEEVMEMRYGRS